MFAAQVPKALSTVPTLAAMQPCFVLKVNAVTALREYRTTTSAARKIAGHAEGTIAKSESAEMSVGVYASNSCSSPSSDARLSGSIEYECPN